MSPKCVRFFAQPDALLLDELPVHNVALAGDTLYSIQLNYRWRKLLAAAMTHYFQTDRSELSLDNQDMLDDFLIDLYDAEALNLNLFNRFILWALSAARTTTSITMVIVTGSNFSHTPTHNTMLIRCFNMMGSTSGGGSTMQVEIRFNGVVGNIDTGAQLFGSAARTMTLVSRFNAVSVGVAHDIALYFRVTAGTGTISDNTSMIYEITEWDE